MKKVRGLDGVLELTKILAKAVMYNHDTVKNYQKFCKENGLDEADFESTMGHEYGLAQVILSELQLVLSQIDGLKTQTDKPVRMVDLAQDNADIYRACPGCWYASTFKGDRCESCSGKKQKG